MILAASCFIALATAVWFETEAFLVYTQLLANLLHIPNLAYLQDYYRSYQNNPVSYPEFLYTEHEGFFSLLLSCPFCTSVFSSLLLSIVVGLTNFPVIAFLGFAGYKFLKKLINA